MLVGRVIEDHVENHSDVPLLRIRYKGVEVSDGSVPWVDGLVVGDVVSEVDLRGRKQYVN